MTTEKGATPKSKYHNVFWHKTAELWIVKIHKRNNPSGKQTIHVGYTIDEEEGARIADVAAYLVCDEPKYNFPLVGGRPVAPPTFPYAKIVQRLLDLKVICPAE